VTFSEIIEILRLLIGLSMYNANKYENRTPPWRTPRVTSRLSPKRFAIFTTHCVWLYQLRSSNTRDVQGRFK